MSETIDIDLTGIDTSAVGDGGGWSALPAGEYRVMVTKSELKDTKAGTGKRLALELTILSKDETNGRTHWEGLNIKNPNEVAERIAHEHLAMIADAAGLERDFLKTAGTGALEGKVVMAEIGKIKAKPDQLEYADQDGYQNQVRSYASTNSVTKAAQPTPESPETTTVSVDVPF